MGKETWETRDYSYLEIAVSCVNWVRSTKVQSGDIVVCRPALGHIGFKEAKIFLWLPIENFDTFHPEKFHDLLTQNDEIHDKRRYCIPLNRLEQVYPSIDLQRVVDTDDPYQPFFQLDSDTYKFLLRNEILQYSGLIFDKVTGLYL